MARYNLSAIIGGWLAAIFSMVIITAIFRGAFTDLAGGALSSLSGNTYVGLVIIGFVGYLIGGFVAGYLAKVKSTIHGLLTVVFGILFGLLVGFVRAAIVDPSLAWTQIVPAARIGVPFSVILADAGITLLAASLLAGLVGGYLGGLSVPARKREEVERKEHEIHPPKAA